MSETEVPHLVLPSERTAIAEAEIEVLRRTVA